MTEQSTFARRVRAAKPRTAKYEVRDDVVSRLALSIQPTGARTFFLARMVRGRRRHATIGSADAMTIPEAGREAKSNGRDTILFDKALPGFGLRIHPSGRKVWIVQARIEGRSRRIVIARHGEIELAEARRRARDMLACIRAGGNPADDIQREKKTPTLRAVADEHLRRCEPHWKPSGRRTMRIYLKARILPPSAGCRSMPSAPRTWPRGSTRPARTSPARPTAPSRYCVR